MHVSSGAEAKLKQAGEILASIVGDTSVPRNIRRVANEARETLLEENKEPSVRAAFAASMLDEVSNDPNMPMHTRTTIWNVLSILETIRE